MYQKLSSSIQSETTKSKSGCGHPERKELWLNFARFFDSGNEVDSGIKLVETQIAQSQTDNQATAISEGNATQVPMGKKSGSLEKQKDFSDLWVDFQQDFSAVKWAERSTAQTFRKSVLAIQIRSDEKAW